LLTLASGTAVAQDPEPETPEAEQSASETTLGQEVVPGQIIVKYKGDAGAREQAEVRSEEGLKKEDDLNLINAEVVEVEDQPIEEVISDLEDRPEVAYAERNFIVHPTGYTDEPRISELWGLDNTGQTIKGSTGTTDVDVDAPEAATVTQGDQNLVVAVIDDGVDFSHPDLANRAWINPDEVPNNGADDDRNGYVDDVSGWDFFHNDNSVHDVHDFHGTHVAGTIAASVNNQGVVGVAPNVKIMALKFLGPRGGDT
jgi:subtilisin family serine protease